MPETVNGQTAGRAERTEQRIVSAAEALFRTRGYRGTALTAVAAAAGGWYRTATTASSLLRRVSVFAAGSRELMERIGPLLAVSAEAEPTEPTVAEAARAARAVTFAGIRHVWERLRADDPLHPEVDLDWVITTATPLSTPDTYLVLALHRQLELLAPGG